MGGGSQTLGFEIDFLESLGFEQKSEILGAAGAQNLRDIRSETLKNKGKSSENEAKSVFFLACGGPIVLFQILRMLNNKLLSFFPFNVRTSQILRILN